MRSIYLLHGFQNILTLFILSLRAQIRLWAFAYIARPPALGMAKVPLPYLNPRQGRSILIHKESNLVCRSFLLSLSLCTSVWRRKQSMVFGPNA